MAHFLLCCAIPLTGCQSAIQRQVIPLEAPRIDPALLLPCPEPYRPGPDATQRDAAMVIEDLRESLANCNADKEAIRRILK